MSGQCIFISDTRPTQEFVIIAAPMIGFWVRSRDNQSIGQADNLVLVSHGMNCRSDDIQTSIQFQFQPSPIDLYRPQNAFPSSLAPDSSWDPNSDSVVSLTFSVNVPTCSHSDLGEGEEE